MDVTALQTNSADVDAGGVEKGVGARRPSGAESTGAGTISDQSAHLRGSALPEIVVPIERDEMLAALEKLARRGKLAGFRAIDARGGKGACFAATAVGTPFEGEVRAVLTADSPGHTRVRFDTRVHTLGLWVTAVVLALTVWPGVVLTESLVASNFPHSNAWQYTWYWYLPLTVPFVPWTLWVARRRSSRSVQESAREVIESLARDLGGRMVEPGRPAQG